MKYINKRRYHLSNERNNKKQIFTIRGKQVIIDKDLAELYEVETKQLNKAVKRNFERFPKNFMFQLTKKEFESLRFQNDTSKQFLKNKNYLQRIQQSPKTTYQYYSQLFADNEKYINKI